MTEPLLIENDGPKLVSTNYWQSEHASRGLLFLSVNAGCCRMLVPPVMEGVLPDMVTDNVVEVVLTRGRFQGKDSVEVMFEDNSKSPYCVHIDARQCDRLWLPQDEGKPWMFAIYTTAGEVAVFTQCFLRRAKKLPFAQPRKR